MPYAPVSGTRIYYDETGPSGGRPLLLLHASLQTAESMAPLRELLAPLGLRIVIPDQRGHGRTANPGRTLAIGQLADDMEALMAHLGVGQPLLAGFSLGATVGIELARRGHLSGLVVLAGRIHTAPRGRKAFDPADIRQRSPLWVKQLEAKHVEIPWDELAVELGTMFEVPWPGFSAADLASIACPTLVVQGDRDLMVPVEQGRELAASVQHGEFRLAPRAGHPDLLYRQETKDAVRDFFSAQLARPPM
ncbi:MAG TPA: alpha/beta fold hydrolase [Symbiobacteriaceae bacterium]|nr:alpha/beta fold hydrolase [Symbiobacteriaceae bacterium]